MRFSSRAVLALLVTISVDAPARATPVDFATQVQPILQRACVKCHGEGKKSAGLRLHTGAGVRAGGVSGDAVTPGRGAASYLVQRLRGEGGEDRMPNEGDPLPEAEIAL